MIWKNFFSRPYILRLSYVIIIVGFILLMNFLLIKNIYEENISKRIELQCTQLNNRIIDNLTEIENVAKLIAEQPNNEFLSSNKTNILNLHSGINKLEILPYCPKKMGWGYEKPFNGNNLILEYCTNTNDNNFLVISMKDNWVNSFFDGIILEEITNVFFFDEKLDFLWKTGKSSTTHHFNKYIDSSLMTKITSVPDSIISKGLSNKTLKISKKKVTYLFFIIKNNKLNTLIAYHHPHGVFNSYLVIYFKNLSLIILFFIVIYTFIDIRTDLNNRKPYNSIIETLKRSKYIKAPFLKNEAEASYIKKCIEMLHNQLDQHKAGLEKTKVQQQKLASDLKLAKKLQENLLIKDSSSFNTNALFNINAISESAFEVGGDFYDYFFIGTDKLLFTIADVAGKGIPASLFMIYAQTLLRSIAQNCSDVAEICNKLNDRLLEEKVSELFITIFIGILDLKSGDLSYCNAAHNYPLLIKSKGTIEELTDTHGIPVGIYPNRKYGSTTINLEKNDQLFLFTDGLTDSQDENNVTFSVDVVKYNLMGSWFMEPKEIVSKIKDCVTSFRGNRNPEDDMTLMCVKLSSGL